MSKITIQYLAGFFDGEGSVSLFVDKKSKYKNFKIRIVNTDKYVLDYIKKTFGGKIYSMKRYHKNHKDKWSWDLNGKAALPLIKSLYPFCIIKKQKLIKYMKEYNYDNSI